MRTKIFVLFSALALILMLGGCDSKADSNAASNSAVSSSSSTALENAAGSSSDTSEASEVPVLYDEALIGAWECEEESQILIFYSDGTAKGGDNSYSVEEIMENDTLYHWKADGHILHDEDSNEDAYYEISDGGNKLVLTIDEDEMYILYKIDR